MSVSYSTPTIESDDQFGCVDFLPAWRSAAQKLLIRSGPIVESYVVPRVRFHNAKRTFQYDWLPSGLIYLVSTRLRDVLQDVEAEFLPIDSAQQGRSQDYSIMHLLIQPAAIDVARSVFERYDESLGNGISKVEILVFDHTKLNGAKGFVLDELGIPFFRNDICDRILDAGIAGIKFLREDVFKYGCQVAVPDRRMDVSLDAENIQVDLRFYDGSGNVVQTGPNGNLPTGYAAALNKDIAQDAVIGDETRRNLFDATGRLLKQRVFKSDSLTNVKDDITYTYDNAGNVTKYVLDNKDGSNYSNTYLYTVGKAEGYREKKNESLAA